jgi:hypothetical protein
MPKAKEGRKPETLCPCQRAIERKDSTPQFSYIEVKEIFHKKDKILFRDV